MSQGTRSEPVSATLNCGSCHGSTTTGIPTYATGSPKANSHTAHNGYRCAACHNSTVNDRTSNTTLAASLATHVNGAKTVAFNTYPVDQTAGTYNTGSYTCGATYCHSNGNPITGPSAPNNVQASLAWNSSLAVVCGDSTVW